MTRLSKSNRVHVKFDWMLIRVTTNRPQVIGEAESLIFRAQFDACRLYNCSEIEPKINPGKYFINTQSRSHLARTH